MRATMHNTVINKNKINDKQIMDTKAAFHNIKTTLVTTPANPANPAANAPNRSNIHTLIK